MKKLALNETLGKLALTKHVQWYDHVMKRKGSYTLRSHQKLSLNIKGIKMSKMACKKQVEGLVSGGIARFANQCELLALIRLLLGSKVNGKNGKVVGKR